MACMDVIEPFFVEVILSCRIPISVPRLGWYPTAEGILPRSAETSEPASVYLKMLSINIRTSCPWSLKYSATVNADNATLALAPGGSFICPYIRAAFGKTPECFISRYRSLPSLVLSPTPANTDTPP